MLMCKFIISFKVLKNNLSDVIDLLLDVSERRTARTSSRRRPSESVTLFWISSAPTPEASLSPPHLERTILSSTPHNRGNWTRMDATPVSCSVPWHDHVVVLFFNTSCDCCRMYVLRKCYLKLWTNRAAASAAALKFWRLGWRLGMGLGPILERHNVFQWDLAAAAAAWHAAWHAAWCLVCLYT